MRPPLFVFTLSWLCSLVAADITVQHLAQATMVASGAHNATQLTPPALPNPMPNLSPFIQLTAAVPNGISIQHSAGWLGFSIEMSVANQVLGHNSSLIQVPFLNLMHNIVQRAGTVHIRVGGNTQDYATVDTDSKISELQGRILYKDKSNIQSNNPTATPPVYLSLDFFYLLRNISSLTNVHWYLSIPFNDTNWRLGMVDESMELLGDYLLGYQTANEPDFYLAHGHRTAPYNESTWMGEFGELVQTLDKDTKYDNAKTQLIVPSIANANGWQLQNLWDLGLVDQFNKNIKFLAAERYPTDNCAAVWGGGTPVNPQDALPSFLSHNTYLKNLISEYTTHTGFAQSKNKPFLMFETNTASCGGFPGISDAFAAVLWGLDYAMQMAHGNFSGAMFHVGGQTTFYNPFTAAPTNETVFHQWTVGSMYYPALVMAEIIGTTNTTQILDLNANNGDEHTPAYIVYENGKPNKLALFNYMDSAGGNAQLTVSFAIGGSGANEANGTPSSVKVKYLVSNHTTDTGDFTWAGQTLGHAYSADGRLQGEESVQTVNCNSDNTCQVTVPAPGFALVFLAGDPNPTAGMPSQTFSTSIITQTRNTATIDPSVLAVSNGHQAVSQDKYSTSFGTGNKNAGVSVQVRGWATVGAGFVIGWMGVMGRRL